MQSAVSMLDKLTWRPVPLVDDRFARVQYVPHSEIPFQVLCQFYNQRKQTHEGYYYELSPIREDLYRAPHKIAWRRRKTE